MMEGPYRSAARVAAPLAIGLAVAGIVVVGIDVGLYLASGPDSTMKDTEKAIRKATAAEFGEDRMGSRTEKALALLFRDAASVLGERAR
jgi:hypothetical protein